MAARVLGRVGAVIGRSSLQARSLSALGRAHVSPVSSLQRQLFDKRSHARVQAAPYHATAPVLKRIQKEFSIGSAKVPTVPGVHPNSGGYELPHNPPDRPPMSTAVYITATSVEDKPNELFPDPGTNWYRILNSLTGLKGIALQNYLSGYFRHAFGYHRDAGFIGVPRNRSPYVWPCAMWASVIVVSKELMVIDAEWLAVPFYWFTWWCVVTFGKTLRPMLHGAFTKPQRAAARRERLTETMYTVKELIQTHHDFIGFVRGLPAMANELADLAESRQMAERNIKHHQVKQFIESFLESKLRVQQSQQAARQQRFEQEAPEYIAKLLQDPSVKDKILDSTIEMVVSGGKQKTNPVQAAYLSYIQYVRKNAIAEAKAAEAARPAIERAVAKARAIRSNVRHEIALKLKEVGGPDLTPFAPLTKAEPLTEAEEALLAKNREANEDQRVQWTQRLQTLIPVRQHAVKA